VYNDELQIKFTFRSGPMIFGRVMAPELWNLAKYWVVTTLFQLCLHFAPKVGRGTNIELFPLLKVGLVSPRLLRPCVLWWTMLLVFRT